MSWIWKNSWYFCKSKPNFIESFFCLFVFLDLITCLDTASKFLEPEFRYDCICDFFFLNVTVHLLYPHLTHLIIMYVV